MVSLRIPKRTHHIDQILIPDFAGVCDVPQSDIETYIGDRFVGYAEVDEDRTISIELSDLDFHVVKCTNAQPRSDIQILETCPLTNIPSKILYEKLHLI